jgi:hypothetical protein
MNADRPGSRYWKLIEPYWLPLNKSWDDDPQPLLEKFRTVPAPVGRVYAAHWKEGNGVNSVLLTNEADWGARRSMARPFAAGLPGDATKAQFFRTQEPIGCGGGGGRRQAERRPALR